MNSLIQLDFPKILKIQNFVNYFPFLSDLQSTTTLNGSGDRSIMVYYNPSHFTLVFCNTFDKLFYLLGEGEIVISHIYSNFLSLSMCVYIYIYIIFIYCH